MKLMIPLYITKVNNIIQHNTWKYMYIYTYTHQFAVAHQNPVSYNHKQHKNKFSFPRRNKTQLIFRMIFKKVGLVN